MEVIQSFGGPLIAIDRECVHLWTGIDGKGFIGDEASNLNDYEAAGELTDGRNYPPCNVAKIIGQYAEGLLITLPYETAIVLNQEDCVYLAQCESADPDWDFSEALLGHFDKALFNNRSSVLFQSAGFDYKLFDSSIPGARVGSNALTFKLVKGNYCLCDCVYSPDDSTNLILYKIDKI